MAKFLYPCPVLGNEDDYSEEASFTFEKELILNIEEDGVQLTIPKPKINDNEINNYLKNDDVLKCAASIRIEGAAINLVKKMKGNDPSSIMGLPLIKLIQYLEKFGVKALSK